MPIEKADEMLASEMLMGWWQEDNGEPNPHDEAGEYITNHGGLATFTDDAFEPCMIDDAVDSRLGGGCMFLDLSTFNMPVYREPVKEKMTMPTAVGYLSDLLAKECLLQGDQQALRTVLDLLDSIEVVTDDETETK